jgi:hypothetical protein
MLKKETVTTAATVGIGFGIAFLIVGTSQTFQSCIGEHYHHESSEPLQKGFAQLLVMSKVGSGCFGEFVHKNAEAIIALFTIILGIATWLLWCATKKLVEGADKTAERQLRAYVTITNAEASFDGAGDLTATIRITNCGQTPAYNVSVSRDIRMLDWQNPQFPPIASARTSRFTLAKDQPMEIAVVLSGVSGVSDMRGDRFDAEKSIYIFGDITYHDIFKERLRHTPFRLICIGRESGTIISPTEEGNDPN